MPDQVRHDGGLLTGQQCSDDKTTVPVCVSSVIAIDGIGDVSDSDLFDIMFSGMLVAGE